MATEATEWRINDPLLYSRIIAALDVHAGRLRDACVASTEMDAVAAMLEIGRGTVQEAVTDFRNERPVEALTESEEPAAAVEACLEGWGQDCGRLTQERDDLRAALEQAREERNHAKVAARREAGEELARLRADRDLLERIQKAVWSEMREGDTPEGCVLRLRADRDRLAAEVETITRERDEARAEAPPACEECGRLRACLEFLLESVSAERETNQRAEFAAREQGEKQRLRAFAEQRAREALAATEAAGVGAPAGEEKATDEA